MRSYLILVPLAAGLAQTPDITPVFQKYCMSCHSKAVKMGGLDLETEEGLKTGGHRGPVVVKGDPAESRLFQMVSGAFKPAMPMDGTKLTKGELDLVAAWIKAGAPAMKAMAPEAAAAVYKPRKAVAPQIFSIAYTPDGRTIAAGGFREIRLIDALTGKLQGTLSGHADAVRSVAFSRDGAILAAAGGLPSKQGELKLWDVAKREARQTFTGHKDCIYSVAISPDGKTIATSSYDKMIRVWTLSGESREFKDHIDAVYSLAFTPDGKRLVSGAADRTIKIWNVETGERMFTFGEPTDGINAVAISPDGKLVAAAGADKSIRLWTIGEKQGALLSNVIAHEDAILDLAFSPDGKRIVSASSDRSIKIFSVPELAEVKTLGNQPDWPYAVKFAPDGKTFAAGRYDGSLSVYDAEKFQDLIEAKTASAR